MRPTRPRRLAGATVGGLLLAAATPLWAAPQAVEEARAQLAAGEARAAMITLKNFLQDDPDHAAARLVLGRTYLRLGKLEAAALALERAAEAGAAATDWRPVMARVRLYQGRPEAVLAVAEVRAQDPDDHRAEMLVVRGLAHIRMDQRDKAAEAFQRALALKPDHGPALRGQASLALDAGELERADELLAKARAADPEEAGIRVMTARLRERQGRDEAAAEAYRKALALAPGNRQAALGLARLHLRGGEVAAADKVLAKLPEDRHGPLGRYLTAVVAVERGDLERAREILDTLVTRANYPPARLLSGWVAFQQGRYETAVNALERHLQQFAANPRVVKLLAAAHLRLGQAEAAVSALERVGEAAADDPQYRLLAGRAKIAAGDYSAGMADLKAAARQSPDDARIRSQVAAGYLAGGQREQAVPQLEKAVSLDDELLGGHLLLVLTHLQNGDNAKAVAEAEKLAQKDTESPIPFNLLGLAYQAQGEAEAARANFRKALERDGGFHSARLNLARLAVADGRVADAREQLSRILGQDGNHEGALMLKAALAERDGDVAARGRWLERAWQAHPQSLTPGLALIRHRFQQGEPLPALKVARALKAHYPEHPGVLANLAEAQLRTDHSASAVENFRTLVQQQPDSAGARHWLARAYLKQDRYGQAREQLVEALRLQPGHAPSLRLLAGLELQAGNPERAAEVAAELQSAAPDAAAGYLLAGRAHWQMQARDQAKADFQAALERGPSRLAVHRLFQIHRHQGHPERAEALLTEWLGAHPGDHGVRVLLAGARQQRGDLAGAVRAYERVREAKPERADIWNNLAWIYHQQGDDRALRYARKAHDLAPENPAITDTYGWILVESGQPEKGLRLLQDAAIHAPQVPSIRYHLGVALWKTGQKEQARKALNQALQTDGSFPEAAQAREVLERLRAASGT